MTRWRVLLVSVAFAVCPQTPALRDDDGEVTVLAQNIKFIATGGKKDRRAELLAEHLDSDRAVDLVLFSEARQLGPLREALTDWCVYTQTGDERAYAWGLNGPVPGGLALAVRTRQTGVERTVAVNAGRVYRARPVTLAEGFLGRIAGWEKGWAVAAIDGTEFVWTHTQASYARSPIRGAGQAGVGRFGQFDDLADDLGSDATPTLLTGDLNLLDGTNNPSEKVQHAGAVDRATIARFTQKTDIRFPEDRGPCSEGSFLGSIREFAKDTFPGLVLDRVGTNSAFLAEHPGTQTQCEHVHGGGLSVSDHMGVRIAAPFAHQNDSELTE